MQEMLSPIENLQEKSNGKEVFSIRAAFLQLQGIMEHYLATYPNVSLNGLAKRCAVSEPTLRRIRKGQTKTLPSVTTIIEILSYILKEDEMDKLIPMVGGPLAKYLKDKTSQLNARADLVVSEELTQTLKDPIKYLVFKLTVHTPGVQLEKVVELFGSYGEKQLLQLEKEGLVIRNENNFKAKIDYFALSNEVFVDHFKTTADFIKPHKHASAAKAYSPIFSNYSSSINRKGYSEVVKIQRAANRKIAALLADPKYQGSIPTFALNAVDTLDNICADEFQED